MNGGAIFLHSCVVIGKISTDIYDALRSHSAIAELLVTRIVGLMAEHETCCFSVGATPQRARSNDLKRLLHWLHLNCELKFAKLHCKQ